MKLIFLLLTFISCLQLTAQKKQVEAIYLNQPLKIDGILDDGSYQSAFAATDFVQLEPYNGQPAMQKTEVYFFYDQTAVYLGAILYDSAPDSIYNYLSERDNIGAADYFGVYFDPYNEGQLSYGFFITPAGVQTDIKAIKSDRDREDANWDAVWESKTRITNEGWTIEMRIPYSALRFPEKDVHTWGLNMFRNIRRYNSNNSWSFIDRNISGFIHQQGELTGISNIKPPTRLSFTPYMATYLEHNENSGETDFIYKGGLDLKYGINESFTLDMMLIPDFGQIQSDDKQLNLSPYEIYYDERRQFFTEGMELFDRADIFYSRRIGSRPKFAGDADDALHENEIIADRPSETQLVNATKISGRTKRGTAIGVLNAMSLNSHATLGDTITNQQREVLIQPFTNYNVTVVDQSLKNNSYISLINTNMLMYDHAFMANVTGTEFQFRDKSLNFALSGKGGISHRGAEDKETGWFTELELAKNGGKWQYGMSQEAYSKDYNPNDMGYLRRNNLFDTDAFIRFQQVEPFSIFRQWMSQISYIHDMNMEPFAIKNQELSVYTEGQFMNNYGFEVHGVWMSEEHNYDETRVEGRYFYKPPGYRINLFMHTDWTKKISAYGYFGGYARPERNQDGNWMGCGIQWRIGQKLILDYELGYDFENNDYGYVDKNEAQDSIHFSQRNLGTVENILEMAYTFNNKLSLRLRSRHYWSSVENLSFYLLQEDGSLLPDHAYNDNHDHNFNAFNVDMVVRWVFAPGSEMTLGWKNSIFHLEETVTKGYKKNLDIVRNSPQINTLSFKLLYYIDYNSVFKKST
ncbi:carbohydrate binding family 9 domain-containing protein [Carboxylicivirga mesophila]|uniref:Carbohydrate binding family 9 domain-containing protein n=1 Tax=Carboxylicivirga mesophila TaxID=1166478 RepID=A0ABS5KEM7_9BACT|nr:DUF5916 domain-containing protein [Carboxylicivirga mesophila]MBS2213493.1 carbohydrate binding family 9 domain-containing protein [Carboxylicivirga mesophila]